MFLTKKHLSRRTVLKGIGASLGLPLLDAMIPAGTAQSHRNNFLEVDISGVSVSGLISKAAELLPLFELCFAW